MTSDGFFSPLIATTLRKQARRSIRESIIRGDIEVGELYTVQYFSSRLGISSTPIREALYDLVAVGLIEVERNRGFRIYKPTKEDIDDIRDVLSLLELPIVVKLASIIKPEDISKLRVLAESIEDAAQKGDFVRYLEEDRLFHASLVDLFGNRRLQLIVSQMRDLNRSFLSHNYSSEISILKNGAKQHKELLDALGKRDEALVKELMQKHLKHGSYKHDE